MLKIKFFDGRKRLFRGKHDEDFNAFIAKQASRNGKNSPGILVNPNGIYVFYEDGEPLSASEQVGTLKEHIAQNKSQILEAEPQIRMKTEETERFKQLILDAKEGLTNEHNNKKAYDHQKQINELQQKINGNELWLLGARAGQTTAKEQNKYYRAVIDDIESGTWQA